MDPAGKSNGSAILALVADEQLRTLRKLEKRAICHPILIVECSSVRSQTRSSVGLQAHPSELAQFCDSASRKSQVVEVLDICQQRLRNAFFACRLQKH